MIGKDAGTTIEPTCEWTVLKHKALTSLYLSYYLMG